jgi:tRNA(Met) C34 N-acetyltransferase TmcA
MTHTEQHEMLMELKDYSRKMKRSDQEDFEMYLKRDKDDEDLDQMSWKRLRQLYELYVPAHLRNY